MGFFGQIPECMKWYDVPILKHVKDSQEFNELFVYALPAGHPGRTYDAIIISLLLHFMDILCHIKFYFRQEKTILTCNYSKSVPPKVPLFYGSGFCMRTFPERRILEDLPDVFLFMASGHGAAAWDLRNTSYKLNNDRFT